MLALSEHCRAVVDTATFLTIDRKDEETGYDQKEVKDKDAHTYNDNDRGKDIQIIYKKTHAKTNTIRQGQDIRKITPSNSYHHFNSIGLNHFLVHMTFLVYGIIGSNM